MNITRIKQNNNPNFTALHIARTKSKISDMKEICLDIYKITPEDYGFLNILGKTTDLHKLMPEIKYSEVDVWQELLKIAVIKAKNNGYLAVHNKKPCGLMQFTKTDKKYNLDIICTIPTEINTRVPNVGKSLMSIMFDDFMKSNANRIELAAVTNAPFNAYIKYTRLGFKQTGGENGVVSMKLTREKLAETMRTIQKYLKTEYLNPTKTINLDNL